MKKVVMMMKVVKAMSVVEMDKHGEDNEGAGDDEYGWG